MGAAILAGLTAVFCPIALGVLLFLWISHRPH
jgi:hypothetical protein